MSLEDELAKMQEIVEFLQRLEAIEQPSKVKDAVTEGWELQDAALAGIMEGYKEVERRADSQRVVPVRAVLAIMQQMEAELVTHLVSSPGEILWGKVQAFSGACAWVVSHLPEIWRGIIDTGFAVGVLWEYLDEIVSFFAKYLLEIVTATAILAVIAKGSKVRDGFADRMRKKALPQSTAPRKWRRRKTRS